MPLGEAITSAIPARTLCCRTFSFNLQQIIPSVEEGYPFTPIVQSFTLVGVPSSDLDVTLALQRVTCIDPAFNGGSGPNTAFTTISPTHFSFTPTTPTSSLRGNFSVRGYQGCYQVSASASSTTSSTIMNTDNYTTAAGLINIVDPNTVRLPAPTATCRLSQDALKLLLEFDADTQQPGASSSTRFPCSALLRFTESGAALCQWTSPRRLEGTLYSGANANRLVTVGDTVLLRGVCVY
jgi:hypothetical protein